MAARTTYPTRAGDPEWDRREAATTLAESFDDPSKPPDIVEAEPAVGVTRVCLVGESAAQGLFYAPHWSPAEALRARLGPPDVSRHEIIDCTAPGIGWVELLHLARAAMQLRPHVLLFLAGNNWVFWRQVGSLARPRSATTSWLTRMGTKLATEGSTALKGVADAVVSSTIERVLDHCQEVARRTRVRIVWAIPAANRAGTEILHPVYWLPDMGVRDWHRGLDRAASALASGDFPSAEAQARGMITLDGGACATSWHLLARALHGAGRSAEATAASEAAVDASGWSDYHRLSGISATMRAALANGCEQRGLPHVDLANVLEAEAGPDHESCFLDHSHFSSRGIDLVSNALVDLLGQTARNVAPAPDPKLEASARLQAALYDLYANQPVVGAVSTHVVGLLTDAISLDPTVMPRLCDHLKARFQSSTSYLSRARFADLDARYPLPEGNWGRWTLPALELEALREVERSTRLEASLRASLRAALDDVEDAAIAANQPPPSGLELATPRYTLPRGQLRSGEHPWLDATGMEPRPRLFRARLPASIFWVVTNGDVGMSLRAVLRAPHADAEGARLQIAVDGRAIGERPVGGTWSEIAVLLDKSLLPRGVRRVEIHWPELGPVGDAALRPAAERLSRAMPADIYPVFGEVFSAIVTPQKGQP